MYGKIVNPVTGRRVSIYGKIGKNVLKNYLQILNGGATDSNKWTYGKLQKVVQTLEKIINCNKVTTAEIVSECGVSVLQLIEIKKCFKWIEKIINKHNDKSLNNHLLSLNILVDNLDKFINTITRKTSQTGGGIKKTALIFAWQVASLILSASAADQARTEQIRYEKDMRDRIKEQKGEYLRGTGQQYIDSGSKALISRNTTDLTSPTDFVNHNSFPIVENDIISGIIHHNATHDVWCQGDECLVAPDENIDRNLEEFCQGNAHICSGSLGIPRKFMPQIPTDEDDASRFQVDELVDKILENTEDVTLEPDDIFSNDTPVDLVKLDDIKPIQSEAWKAFITDKQKRETTQYPGISVSLGNAYENGYTHDNTYTSPGPKALKNIVTKVFNKNPILVVNHEGQDYLLDGHHRFFGFKKHNENVKENNWNKDAKINSIPARRIYLPKDIKPLDVIRFSHDVGYPHKNLIDQQVNVIESGQPRWIK
jgi:hypothetical protein